MLSGGCIAHIYCICVGGVISLVLGCVTLVWVSPG